MRDAAPAALLTEEPEVLLAVGRHLAQHRDPPVALAGEPADDERGVAADSRRSRGGSSSHPADARCPPRLSSGTWSSLARADDHRVVGAVGAGDADAALVDQVLEAVDRVLRRPVRQPVLGVQHELVRPIQQPGVDGLVEGHLMDLVEAPAGTVQARTQPPDLDRVHTHPFRRRRHRFVGRCQTLGSAPCPAAVWSIRP